MTVLHLTTSFPITAGSASGAFVLRLVESLPPTVGSTVLVPAATAASGGVTGERYRIRSFRYAPRRWQRLAHMPGGIPVALARSRLMFLLLPVFLAAMVVACAWHLRRAHILHAHWSVNGVLGGLVAVLLGKPCVTTLWGEDVTRAYSSPGYRWILSLCLRFSRRVVCVSQAMHRQVTTRFPEHAHKLAYVPNGVGQALAEQPLAGRAELPGFVVLYVGSLIPRKAVDVLIRAWAAVDAEERKDWTLVLVGPGPEEGALRELAGALGIGAQVRFAGSVPPGQVGHQYRQADAFVLPSRSEGMPSVVLEAMAAGLPIIATRIDGVDELVTPEREGLLFPVGDHLQLASHLRRLGADAGLRRRMGAAARQRIRSEGFLWPAIGIRYADLYSELREPRRPRVAGAS